MESGGVKDAGVCMDTAHATPADRSNVIPDMVCDLVRPGASKSYSASDFLSPFI